MTESRIADVLNAKSRFLRSAHLERDFRDPDVFSGYVVTDFAGECMERLAEGLKPQSGQRAWRLTGDYGSGKSSFALLVAHWFAGHDSNFPPQVRKVIDFERSGVGSRQLIPVLVTCTRESLATSIVKALSETLAHMGKFGTKARLVKEIEEVLAEKAGPNDDEVIDLVLKVNSRIIASSNGKGLLLVLDELGKFLEFAAINPQRQDVFLLQRLAEVACRSGHQPLFILCLLHQGFSAYADHLSQSAQREWEKVAGRFDEIIFDQPIEQIAALISSALNVRTDLLPGTKAKGAKESMQEAIALGWFRPSASKKLLDTAVHLYPLHPTVLPILIRVFRRFGQNERSLFSFLLSNEPFGLQAFSEKRLKDAEPYRLHDFYDYVRASFGHRLAVQSYRSHWNLIDSVIESFATEDDLHVKVLKTVGILNLLNDTDLLPTREAVVCAMACHEVAQRESAWAALEELQKAKRVLYDRGRARGLCLWPHTSVDLEKAYEDARHAVDTPQSVAALIGDYLEARPIVARRHYIETGNLRHYEVRYCSVMEMPTLLDDNPTEADGLIVIPLCETLLEHSTALAFAKRAELKRHQNWLVAVPQPLSNLVGLVQEVQRWDWVVANTLELSADRFAREEVSRQAEAARTHLEKRVQNLIGIRQRSIQTGLELFHQGLRLKVSDGRDLLSTLSRIFDATYSSAPSIHNELVNRRNLSSAAAGARMRLIERMFTDASSPFLGMDSTKKPPEMSMYLSVLKRTGLHRQHGESWYIGEPHYRTDNCNVLPVLRHIRKLVQKHPDRRVSVASLFAELRKPPYGVRDGLIPLLFTVFAISHDNEIAFYKDGTFLRELNGQAILVLTKAPERFEVQYCKIAGVRAALFDKLMAVLQFQRFDDKKTELLDVVKPLCLFVAQLPAYVLNTKRLSPIALAVRDTILDAREPGKLLFSDLPVACGFKPVSTRGTTEGALQTFVKKLKAALDELRGAHAELQERLRARLRESFPLSGSSQQFRTALAARAEHILLAVTEPKLRAFCLRLIDDNLPELDWLESVGSYLALKPPSKWHDAEEDVFNAELAQMATTFHRVESILFAGKASKNIVGVRLAITQSNGVEHEQVVHFTVEEENKLLDLQIQFEALLDNDRRLGLAAASRAIWKSLQDGGRAKYE